MHLCKADIRITADARTGLGFLAGEKSLPLALLRRKVKIKGDPRLLLAFGKCFLQSRVRHKKVQVLPETSALKREPSRYLRNDPATGKIRWLGTLVLAETEDVTHNVKTFRFKPANGAQIPFDYLPGQFLTLHIAPDGVPTKRSYTIASTPTWRDRIEITVKREEHGLVSRWLHDKLKPGDEIEAPNGTFTFTGKEAESVLLICGGVGITPTMSAARYLTETSWTGLVHLILSFAHQTTSLPNFRLAIPIFALP